MVRYYEAGNISIAKKQADFIFRRRHGSIVRTFICYGLGLLTIFIFAYFKELIGGDIGFLTVITLILSALTLISVVTLQKHLDLVTSIEFQNALFSSAFREGKLFSLIVSQDDQMYYADTGFYKLFPDLVKNSSQVLDAIVTDSNSPQANLQRLNHVLIAKEQATFDVNILKDDQRMKARMSIIPLPRPSGYFFVSARLFAESRDEHAPAVSRSEEAQSILSALCEQLSDLAYVLGGNGEIICCTQPFAEWIGYSAISQLEGRNISDFLKGLTPRKHSSTLSDDPEHYQVNVQPLKGEARPAKVSHVHIRNSREDIAFTGRQGTMIILGNTYNVTLVHIFEGRFHARYLFLEIPSLPPA